MTTPAGTPSITTLQGDTPIPVIQRSEEAAPYLITNQDEFNSVWVSPDSAMSPAASNTFEIQGLGAIAVTSQQQWYACTSPGVLTDVNVLPGGTNWSAAPAQIAEVIAPLAAAIAQQIFAMGIPVVSGPEVIYNL
jgi:hypothetical protein